MTTAAMTKTDLHEVLRNGRQGLATAASNREWLGPVRQRGAEQLDRLPMPHRKQEAWRYTSTAFLEQQAYAAVVDGPFRALQPSDIDDLLLDTATDRLVFVNGYFAPALSKAGSADNRVTLATLGGGLADLPDTLKQRLDTIAAESHVFAALNRALMSDGAMIRIAAGASVDRPIEILHVSVGRDEPGICHPRHLVLVDEGASARVIERYVAIGDAQYFNNAVVEIDCAAGSTLVHERLQEESPAAQHLADLHIRLGQGSHYRQVSASMGAAWSRTDVRLAFTGEGASAEFDGLILAGDRQLNDVHLDVRHDVPGCTSRENFKGILDGRGRVVFDGRILVARDAQLTDAQLSNHNLLLSRSAEVDTKPQLEIYADDVKCSHGTTVGELDHDMLFYLRSRGVPERQAKQMLCQGFANDVVSRFADASLQQRTEALLAKRLSQAA
ncbi:MAG: Fe-S cluster assembly protein SufD [Gammaproteobacteria bacterium]|nr:Fe-S cluster assembly protein SufD [Gammaproteobacteria bacterium]